MPLASALSGGPQQGSPNAVGHLNGYEGVGGEEVILAAFVHHAQIPVGRGVRIRQRPVDLV